MNHPKQLGDYLYDRLKKHPQSNSLAAYHYVLSWAGIENTGVYISSETLDQEMLLPAVVHLLSNQGEFVIVVQIDDKKVILDDGRKVEQISRNEFDAIFSGACIVLDPDSKLIIDKKDFFQWAISHLSRYVLPVIVVVGMLLGLTLDIFDVAFAGLFITGFVASIMLYSKQIGLHNKVADSICKSGGEATDCNAVTGSRGGKLFGVISWSDIGVIYFAVNLLMLLIFGYDKIGLIVLVLSIISMPYIFYSIWYQWRVVETWCPLCLTVQAVFAGQLAVAICGYNNGNTGFGWFSLLGFLTIGIAVTTLFYVFKPLIENALKYQYQEIAYLRFRQQLQVRELLLENRKVDVSAVNQLVFNVDAEHIITFVFSPYCGPCIAKIRGILALFEKYEVGLRVVVCLKDLEKQNDRPIVEYFISKYLELPQSFLDLMREYSENYPVIRQQFRRFTAPHPDVVAQIIENHSQWFDYQKFSGTPVIIFDNLILPSSYNLDDLELMILEEQ